MSYPFQGNYQASVTSVLLLIVSSLSALSSVINLIIIRKLKIWTGVHDTLWTENVHTQEKRYTLLYCIDVIVLKYILQRRITTTYCAT